VDRQAAGEIDRLEAPQDLAEGVAECFAVVAGDELGELLAVPPHELAHGEEDPAPGDERRVPPGWEGGRGGGDRLVDFVLAAPRNTGDDLAGGRVVDRPGLLGQDLEGSAVDPVGQDRRRRFA
jgi:hypothetical protein